MSLCFFSKTKQETGLSDFLPERNEKRVPASCPLFRESGDILQKIITTNEALTYCGSIHKGWYSPLHHPAYACAIY
jgi:hypothetical protein